MWRSGQSALAPSTTCPALCSCSVHVGAEPCQLHSGSHSLFLSALTNVAAGREGKGKNKEQQVFAFPKPQVFGQEDFSKGVQTTALLP